MRQSGDALAAMIEVTGLTKSHGSVRVLDGVHLRVPTGSVFALLGPNGAGKTTAVRIMATLTRPDAGQISVGGFDVRRDRRQVRRRISLTGQYAAVDENQTGSENLRMMGRLSRMSGRQARDRTQRLLESFALTEAADRAVRTYSGGMRRRLDIAASLVGSPKVIFLDEPTTGLDPRSRHTMWDVVADLARQGTTVFLTTQYLEEADQLADRIAVLDRGHIVAQGTPAELKHRFAGQRLEITLADQHAFQRAVTILGDRVTCHDAEHLTLGIATDGSAPHVRALLDDIDPHHRAVDRFTLRAASLDDVFLALTGTSDRDTVAHTALEAARA